MVPSALVALSWAHTSLSLSPMYEPSACGVGIVYQQSAYITPKNFHQSLMYKRWVWKEELSYTQALLHTVQTSHTGWCLISYSTPCNCLASAVSRSRNNPLGEECGGGQGCRHPWQCCNMLPPKVDWKPKGKETVHPIGGRQRPLRAHSGTGAPFAHLCRLEGCFPCRLWPFPLRN